MGILAEALTRDSFVRRQTDLIYDDHGFPNGHFEGLFAFDLQLQYVAVGQKQLHCSILRAVTDWIQTRYFNY